MSTKHSLMMKISSYDSEQTPTVEGLCNEFNISADDIDQDYGVIKISENDLVVMASVDGAKALLSRHVDNTVAGKGPYVTGPFSSPGIGAA